MIPPRNIAAPHLRVSYSSLPVLLTTQSRSHRLNTLPDSSRLPAGRRRVFALANVGLWALQAFVLTWQALTCSPAQDELGQLTASIAIAQTGDPGYYRVNPPLGKLITGLPLIALRDVPSLTSASPSYFRPGNRHREMSMPRQYIDNRLDGYRWDFRVGRLARVLVLCAVTGWVLWWMMGFDAGSTDNVVDAAGVEGGSRLAAMNTLVFATLWCTSPLMLGHGWTVMPDALSGLAMLASSPGSSC